MSVRALSSVTHRDHDELIRRHMAQHIGDEALLFVAEQTAIGATSFHAAAFEVVNVVEKDERGSGTLKGVARRTNEAFPGLEGVSVFHLGNFGTAREKLKSWSLT